MKHIDYCSSEGKGDVVQLWILRTLVLCGGYKEFIKSWGFSNDQLAYDLGLQIDFSEDEAAAIKSGLVQLKKQYKKALKNADGFSYSKTFEYNIRNIAEILHLSEVDQRILAFVIYLHTDSFLSDTAGFLGGMDNVNKLCYFLSIILDLNRNDVEKALLNSSRLTQSGLVYIDHRCKGEMHMKLEIISRSFAGRMLMCEDDPRNLLRDIIYVCSEPDIGRDDFSHISNSIESLMLYLEHTIVQSMRGVNILVYGPPGTGKSQLARIVANTMELTLYEIARENSDGQPVDAMRRMRSYKAAQSILSGQKALLLFDEIEDIFNDGGELFGAKSTASTHKSWINRVLEENEVPTLWLTNSVSCMDAAFIRRFDIVIEVPVPPRKHREILTGKLCKELVSADTIRRISATDSVTPAIIARASQVVHAIKDAMPRERRDEILEQLIDSTIVAQGHKSLCASNLPQLPAYYDIDVINSDVTLSDLAERIDTIKSARLCIYGPPGTGKTAYAQWLARYLDMELNVKRASDLISMYVGATEKNIALAFSEAENEGAILLIDEVDSFLQDRRNLKQSWEITAVNEMLTQMESFSGVFIASTNLVDDLDQASLRRFDLKTKFDYLRPSQAWSIFCQLCHTLGIISADDDEKEKIYKLNVLTPGDFTVISRRHRLQPFKSALEMIDALQVECQLKEVGKSHRSIGFV